MNPKTQDFNVKLPGELSMSELENNSQGSANPQKSSLLNRQMSKGKSEHQTKNKKKNGNQLPRRQVLSQSTTKLFITQKETRYSFPIRSKAQNVGALEKILCAQPNTSFKSS